MNRDELKTLSDIMMLYTKFQSAIDDQEDIRVVLE